MTTPLHNSSARWANIHLDRETEHRAAVETLVLLNVVKDKAKKAIAQHEESTLYWQFPFANFDPKHIDFILATIGVGEIRISLDGGRIKLEETAIPALWHQQENGVHSLVLALIPPAVSEAIDKIASSLEIPQAHPQDVFAAPSILVQLQAALEKIDLTVVSHEPAYMLEMTRQPLVAQDREYLAQVLGEGNIEIWLSGFANAHIHSTQVRGIWNNHLLNNAGKELLDSYVVSRIPPEVPVAPEELEDTVRIASDTIHWIEEDIERGALG